ncbi:MAG: NAD(P)H-hydrate dehydratase [Coriobacteriia bacterium]|nr:NAD(P)H-hydrate dehydratase [Coriobacteriia bacterium]
MNVVEYGAAQLASLLPIPSGRTNKYERGKLVLVGGSAAYPGAASLAAGAAQRMGAGYVQVYCAPESVGVVRAGRASAVAASWVIDRALLVEGRSDDERLVLSNNPEALFFADARPGHPVACVLGPGLDAGCGADLSRAERVVRAVPLEVPLLIDGGALSAVADPGAAAFLRRRMLQGGATVLTPHGGEAARLARAVGLEPADRDASDDELAIFAQQLANAYGATVLLKGPDTFLAVAADAQPNADDPLVMVLREGTAALAKAGTGDVLAGMVGALLAQGLRAADAAALGSALHAQAGVQAAYTLTTICVTPEDVIECIPAAVVQALSALGGADAGYGSLREQVSYDALEDPTFGMLE